MSRSPAEHIILAEDLQHTVFIRRLLLELNVPRQKIRAIVNPAGSGSGEQYAGLTKELDPDR